MLVPKHAAGPSCRLCGAPLRDTFVDLGMSPLCESFLQRRAARPDGAVLPAARPDLRRVPARPARGVRPGRGDLHATTPTSRRTRTRGSRTPHATSRLIIERFGLDAEQPRRRAGQQRRLPAAALRRARASRRSASSRRRTSPRRHAERGVETIVDFFGSRLAAQLVADGRARRPRRREQRARAGARPERLRRRHRDRARAATASSTIEFPHLLRLIEGIQFDTIYHEHFSYFSLTTLVAALRRPRARDLRRRGAADARRLAAGLSSQHAGDGSARRASRRSPTLLDARAWRRATTRSTGTRASRAGVEESKRSLLELPDRAAARGQAASPATARPARATRCSTTAASAPTSSSTPSTATRTSTGVHARDAHPDLSRRSRIDETRPDFILILPWNLKDGDHASSSRTSREWGAQLVVPIPRPEVASWPRDRVASMKVVLFCGGLGCAWARRSERIPKPMIPIGDRPILWHIMKYYAHFGHHRFILCLGYKARSIKEYFLNYNEALANDFVLARRRTRGRAAHDRHRRLAITFVDTGLTNDRPAAEGGRAATSRTTRSSSPTTATA